MNDIVDVFMSEYAGVRQLLIEQNAPSAPVTDDQRTIVLHDGYGNHRRSPLGNYAYGGLSDIPQDSPLPYMSREEIRQQPNYGILQRRLDARGDDDYTG